MWAGLDKDSFSVVHMVGAAVQHRVKLEVAKDTATHMPGSRFCLLLTASLGLCLEPSHESFSSICLVYS